MSSLRPYLPFSPSSALLLLLYLLISAPGTGIWKSFGFFLKSLIHTRHILLDADRCTMAWWYCSKMTTMMLWSPEPQKLRRHKEWMPVLCGFLLLGDDDGSQKVYRHPSTSSSPHPLLCVWPICVCVLCTKQCVFKWVRPTKWKKKKVRVWKRLKN